MSSEAHSVLTRLRKVAHGGSPAERELFLASLVAGGPAASPALEAGLHDNDARVQRLVVEALRVLHGPRAILVLRRLLLHRDEQLRRIAARALVDLGSAAVGDLCDLLRHPEWDIRARSVEALGRIGDRRAAPQLCRTLSDPHELVRLRSAGALGHLGDPGAIDALRAALRDESEAVRAALAEALARLGAREAVPDLAAIMERRPGPGLRRAAVRALLDLGWNPREAAIVPRIAIGLTCDNPGLILSLGRAAVPELCGWVRREEPEMRARAVEVLGRIARHDPGPELETALPLLRALYGSRDAASFRARLRDALSAIERAVGAANLPVPSTTREPRAAGLPLVSGRTPGNGALPHGYLLARSPGKPPSRFHLIRWTWWLWR